MMNVQQLFRKINIYRKKLAEKEFQRMIKTIISVYWSCINGCLRCNYVWIKLKISPKQDKDTNKS
jgi:hypothetical protein